MIKIPDLFQEAAKRGIHRTVHAGESSGSREVVNVSYFSLNVKFLDRIFVLKFKVQGIGSTVVVESRDWKWKVISFPSLFVEIEI